MNELPDLNNKIPDRTNEVRYRKIEVVDLVNAVVDRKIGSATS